MSETERIAMLLFEADGLKHADGSTLEQSWKDSPRYHEEYLRRARAIDDKWEFLYGEKRDRA